MIRAINKKAKKGNEPVGCDATRRDATRFDSTLARASLSLDEDEHHHRDDDDDDARRRTRERIDDDDDDEDDDDAPARGFECPRRATTTSRARGDERARDDDDDGDPRARRVGARARAGARDVHGVVLDVHVRVHGAVRLERGDDESVRRRKRHQHAIRVFGDENDVRGML